MLGAALSFAIYTLMVRNKPKDLSSTTYLFTVFFIGTVILLPAWLLERTYIGGFEFNLPIISIFFYLGLGASVISFLSWNSSIHYLGPTKTALFGNLIPVLSTVEAAIILNEQFTWITVISMVIILVGIVIANILPSKRKQKQY